MKYKKPKLKGVLFDEPKPVWEDVWKGMPEYVQEDLAPWQSILVHFKNLNDRQEFSKLINQNTTNKTKYLWYPKLDLNIVANKRFITTKENDPRYPVYIISKGRWESRLTSKSLEKMNVPYHIVVEPQEYDNYAAVIDSKKILVLPFSNLGQGSIPARNWVWEHSVEQEAKRHWILDDNIRGFFRRNNNSRLPVGTGAIFRAAEDFVDRYTNVAISGFHYRMFAPDKEIKAPFYLNTRVYSCILIKNDIPYRWRGIYNEDTDLSIRALKDGWCTILFNIFLIGKTPTMTMKGGNTDQLYSDEDSRLRMARSLQEQHPDIVEVVQKWGRWQHSVNYSKFKNNKLILRSDVDITEEVDNYGMELIINNNEG